MVNEQAFEITLMVEYVIMSISIICIAQSIRQVSTLKETEQTLINLEIVIFLLAVGVQ